MNYLGNWLIVKRLDDDIDDDKITAANAEGTHQDDDMSRRR